MAQENVEVVRRAIDAFNRGDRDAWLADFTPKRSGKRPVGSRMQASIADVRSWSSSGRNSKRTSRS
jgi:hypothetical protein